MLTKILIYNEEKLIKKFVLILFNSPINRITSTHRSLAVVSRSRQSEKQPIVDELALIEHGKAFPCEKNSGDVSRIK